MRHAGPTDLMMRIIGTGIDMVDVRRIEKTLDRFGDRFVQRCFTVTERNLSDGRVRRADSYAKRYAAKEAGAKALGTGLDRGVAWRDIGVVNLPGGRPTLQLTGGAERLLAQLVPAGYLPKIDLTLTDEYPYAQALVIISAVPDISAQDGSST